MSLNELRRKPAGVGWPAKWRKRQAVDAQAARMGFGSFLPDQHKGLGLAGAPKITKARKGSERNARTGLEIATRGKLADCLPSPINHSCWEQTKAKKRDSWHDVTGNEERIPTRPGLLREKIEKECARGTSC